MATTSAAVAKQAAEFAAKSFAGHVLKSEGAHWLCGRPGSSSYSFRVYLPPGAVIVWGDIGEATILHSDRDSLGWLTRAAGRGEYPDYCLGKVAALSGDKREFFSGDAHAYLTERLAEAVDDHDRLRWEEASRAFRDAVDERNHDSERAAWFATWSEQGLDDPPLCDGWSSTALWIWHALVTFVRLHAAAEALTPACACGAKATMGARCMACASREAE